MTRRSTPSGTRVLAAAFGLVCALSVVVEQVEGQAGRSRVLEGNRLYEQGLFEEAHQKYLEAMAEAPESPVIPFNDGNALYQSSDYQRAMDAYRRAIETGDAGLASAAWYNLGNALYRQQQLEQSLEAYKQALRLDPSAVDAKHNLERVLEQMQQQEQQQQSDQQDDEGEDQDPDDQAQSQPQQPPPGEEGAGQPPPPDDSPSDEPSDSSGQDGDESPPSEGEGEAPPAEGEMSREEAERLLDAIDEDPGDVNRKPASTRGRRPRKPW